MTFSAGTGAAERAGRLCLPQFLLVPQGVAEVCVRLGVIGLEFDGLAIGSDRLVQLLLLRPGAAEVVVHLAVIQAPTPTRKMQLFTLILRDWR